MKKKEIEETMIKLFGNISESFGKAYGCFIEVQLNINIKPKRKIGFKRRKN